ncbi:hypothetical protein M2360_000236 [Rhizobium sp. SG_E_25_P2]|uniref:hypothetical protein n=1 Tax=Rhizobium sp. SG_E_25_P2 TaxID=2879942 RepID=UPI002475D52E|nr:hypothetical protein [Rhizobium sp. SG_E_25_P2]MDH6264855.1 hypothetical protein [Rhizobium sp. SG_E_25_P2]
MRYIQFFVAASVVCAAFSASGAYATPLERGSKGLSPLLITMKNDGARPIACGATLAHWYSQSLGTVKPGAVLHAKLWQKQQTGAVFLLNQIEDRMPVERIWCGLAGQSWQTRAEISFERKAGVKISPIVMTCVSSSDGLRCSQK